MFVARLALQLVEWRLREDLTLDEVHDLLDAVEESLTQLSSRTENDVGPYETAGLATAFLALYDGFLDYGSSEARELGVPPKLAKSLLKPGARMARHDAMILGSRLRSLLRTLEGQLGAPIEPRTEEQGSSEKVADALNASVSTKPEAPSSWAVVPQVTMVKAKAAQVAQLLDDIVYAVRASNLPEEDRALSDIERAQLIAVLETAISLLKAPLVERGLLLKCSDWLKRTAARVGQRKAEESLGSLADKGVEDLGDLIDQIPWDNVL